jgi:Mor family transcriptional regulator
MGRQVKWTPEKLAEIAGFWNAGESVASLAVRYGVSRIRIYQLLKQTEVGPVTLDSLKTLEENA